MERGGRIPDFDENGNLPPGVYRVSLAEIEARFVWNERRRVLFSGLKRAVANLARAGVRRVWIDGSFVTAKEEPMDIDGCWEYPRELDFEALDPVLYDTVPPRRPMKRKYGVDFLVAGTPLLDAYPAGQTVEEFFQFTRARESKGILVLEIGDRP
ncbi:MAG: hypothetical protein FJ291_28875 [Planctomycetes bacterium]|nr:hypothetical protein [Planctomycetota bacterium]